MKKTVITILMIVLILPISMTGCNSATPTDTVNKYFSSIKESESKEAQKLIEGTISEEVINEDTDSESKDEKTSDNKELDKSLKMYLSKIDAKVLSEKIKDNKATVEVEIKGPNYSNLLLEVMEESITETFNGKEVNESDVEKNLEDKVKNSKAETRTGKINLVKEDNEWRIKSDEYITNLLLGEADETESAMFSK